MRRLAFLPAFALCTHLACGDDTAGSSSEGGSTAEDTEHGTDADTSSSTSPGTSTDPTTGSSSTDPSSTTDDPSTTTDDPSTTTTTTGTTGDEEFNLGFDVTDVTPTPDHMAQTMYMGAYGAPYTRGQAQGIHDPIYVRSFAVEADGTGLVMAILDLPGMGNQITRAIRTGVAEVTGLAEDQVLVGATHSHSAPDFMGLWGGISSDYKNYVIGATISSMAAAWESRSRGTLRVGTTTAPNNNRRDWEFTDDALVLLDAFDENDQRMGAMVTFAAHPVILGESNKLISRDYCGYTVDSLELALGAPVLLFNGTLGDATPKVPQGEYEDDFIKAQAYGELLADHALEIVEETELVDPYVGYDSVMWQQKVDNILFQTAAMLGLAMYDFEEMGLFDNWVTTQSTYFRLGTQVQGVAFPGESVTRNGLSIKEVMKAPHRLLLGNTGDALGYFIPSDEWNIGLNDNYEEGVSMGMGAGDKARDEINPMILADNAGF